ncbi:MAG: glucose 1-dehydrogenase [Parasphingorhabdus sp.]|uniref:SDR family NAD(P)-dependent oxidoreductase n=3 Tax=Parasphingorhabdus sp. TaxID=2709688 RepID=UPI003263785D
MNYGMAGKVAIVTGASGGIGRATALAFAASGASVLVSDVQDEKGHETVTLIEEQGGTAVFQRCNVADEADVKALIGKAVSDYGRLDYACNNAGINDIQKDEYDLDVWERSLSVNLTGVMLCMKAEAEAMLATGGGAIVNTSSINGLVGNPMQGAYTAGKHGVVGLTRHGALRWAEAGIRVNCVCPGVIETPMTDVISQNPEIKKTMEAMTPMRRLGQPEEIASAIVWLCSDQASFVTGHPMVIDGGATAV